MLYEWTRCVYEVKIIIQQDAFFLTFTLLLIHIIRMYEKFDYEFKQKNKEPLSKRFHTSYPTQSNLYRTVYVSYFRLNTRKKERNCKMTKKERQIFRKNEAYPHRRNISYNKNAFKKRT